MSRSQDLYRQALPVLPGFTLPSVGAGPVSLNELIGRGPVLLLFVSEECPTSALTLRRLAPVTS